MHSVVPSGIRQSEIIIVSNLSNNNSIDANLEQRSEKIACPSCGLAVAPTESVCPRDGTVLDALPRINANFSQHYQILGTVGTGGMSVIYKARQTLLNKIVAIKMLHLHLLNDQAIMRFQREATAASSLRHANVIAVHDFGLTENGQPYMVMDLIEGITLADLIEQKGSLPLPEAIDIFLAVCAALEHAHAHGVLHRDLKPSNIMLSPDNGEFHVHLVDFGIAKIMDTGAGGIAQKLTQTGELFGSPLYMSPEQCMGRLIDQRSDIYSLGCIFYESLVGLPPHRGETLIETIFKHLNDVAVPLNEARTDIVFPQSVVNLVARLLANKPEDRFQTISEVKQELLNIQAGALKGDEERPIAARRQLKLTKPMLVAIAGAMMMFIGLVSLAMATITAQKAEQDQGVSQIPAALHSDKRATTANAAAQPTTMAPSALKNPETLNFDGSKLSAQELIGKIATFPNLDTICLDNTLADDATLRQISKLRKLTTLKLRDTRITDEGLKYLADCKTITNLAISGTGITDSGIDAIGHLGLSELDMWDIKISPDGLSELTSCQQTLKTLTVSHTPLSQKSLQALSKLGKLRYLQLFHIVNLHDDDLHYLSQLPLEKLYIEDCPLTDRCAKHIDSIRSLIALEMNETKITDKFIRGIVDLRSLKNIWLEGVSITDEGIAALVKLQNLTDIYLASSPITDAGLERLSGLPKLANVYANYCPNITRRGIAALKEKMPAVTVTLNYED